MTREECSCLVGVKCTAGKILRGRCVWTANGLAWILVCWFWFLVVVSLGCGCFESHGRFGDYPEWGRGWLVSVGGDPHVWGAVLGGGGGSGWIFLVLVCSLWFWLKAEVSNSFKSDGNRVGVCFRLIPVSGLVNFLHQFSTLVDRCQSRCP